MSAHRESTKSDRVLLIRIVAGTMAIFLLGVGAITIALVVAGGHSAATPDQPVEATLTEFAITGNLTARAGTVRFRVTNAGAVDHEMLVLKTNAPVDKLPIVDAGDPPAPVSTGADKVDEETSVGETGDPNLVPGSSRNFTIENMAPGRYVLVCNLAMHYGKGMRAAFTVTR